MKLDFIKNIFKIIIKEIKKILKKISISKIKN